MCVTVCVVLPCLSFQLCVYMRACDVNCYAMVVFIALSVSSFVALSVCCLRCVL